MNLYIVMWVCLVFDLVRLFLDDKEEVVLLLSEEDLFRCLEFNFLVGWISDEVDWFGVE